LVFLLVILLFIESIKLNSTVASDCNLSYFSGVRQVFFMNGLQVF